MKVQDGPSPESEGLHDSRGAGETHTSQAGPSRKRPRTTEAKGEQRGRSKRARGKRRSLSRLPEMPLDILYEIFCYLDPVDLLHLTRTTKALRNVLMQRSTAFIWKQALAEMTELPGCPDDLNEPQYVRLVFDQHCYYCAARVKHAYWASRVRCCKKCFPTRFIRGWDMKDVTWNELLPGEALPPNVTRCFFLKERINVVWARIQLIRNDRKQLSTFYKTQKAIREKLEESRKAFEFWECIQDELRIEELEDIRERRRTTIIELLRQYDLADELDLMDDLLYAHTLQQKWFKDRTELTFRRWYNIKDDVINYMRRARARRIASTEGSFVTLLSSMYNSIIQKDEGTRALQPLPGIADVCTMPEILALHKVIGPKGGALFIIPKQILEEKTRLIEQLPGMRTRWYEACVGTLLSVMPQDCGSTENTYSAAGTSSGNAHTNSIAEASLSSRLELATTWFACTSPQNTTIAIEYPRILAFPDMTKTSGLDLQSTTLPTAFRNALAIEHQFGPWNDGDFRVTWDAKSATSARLLLEACSKDPSVTTAKEMDELDSRFACIACAKPTNSLSSPSKPRANDNRDARNNFGCEESSKVEDKWKQAIKPLQHVSVPTFSWRLAVRHHTECAHEHERWALLNAEDKERVLKLEQSTEVPAKIWQCNWCRSCLSSPNDRLMTLSEVQRHLSLTHRASVSEPKQGTDYYKAFYLRFSLEDLPRSVDLDGPCTRIPVS